MFISHATEDKKSVAEPLRDLLVAKGCKVWFDNTTLKIGDTLNRKIDEGLSHSRYGVVILSPSFFAKQWPQYELDGLLAREMADAVKVILPVGHNVTQADVVRYSAPLSMRLRGQTDDLGKLAQELAEIILGAGSTPASGAVEDDLSLAKRAILTCALRRNCIDMFEGSMNSGRYIAIGPLRFDNSESQRKLFLLALKELENAELAEHIQGMTHELTYTGMQTAKRLQPLEDPKSVGLDL